MKSIDNLKKYDIKDISINTKIVQQRIKDIIECNFDKLDRARARGFIHILSREYKIDFDDWLEAYDNFYKEKEENIQSNEYQNNADKDKKEQITTIVVDSTMKDKTYIRLIITLAILVILFTAYFVYKNVFYVNDSSDNNLDNDINLSSNITLENNNITDNINKDEDDLKNDPNSIDNSNNLDSMGVESTDNLDALSKDTESDISNKMNIDSKPADTNIMDELVITPKAALWVGIIDLDTYQKKQLSITSDYKIVLDKDKLIRTGHSHFDITNPDKTIKKYIGGNNRYFLYTTDGGLREIKKSDFLSFNRGEEW